jgi:hypothetical protein
MIDMVLIANLSIAPVATSLLALILCLNILSRMGSFGGKFASTPSLREGDESFRICRAVSPTVCNQVFWPSGQPLFPDLHSPFLIRRMVGAIVFAPPLLVGSHPRAGIRQSPFFVGGIVGTGVFRLMLPTGTLTHLRTCFAYASKTIFPILVALKMFCCRGEIPLALVALPKGRRFVNTVAILAAAVGAHLLVTVTANLALRAYAIVATFGWLKILNRCGLPLATPAALFGWNRIWGRIEGHREVTFLVSNPGALARRRPVFSLGFTPSIISRAEALA